ncbi:MAG TPA: sialidase family protein [Thermoanaerobaculia bacterium]|nr:sialidase family protein [Thermoanaerobaculia bacterium]
MRRRPLAVSMLILSLAASAVFAASQRPAEWPSTDKQLWQAQVAPGSALEALILANQDFKMLRAEEVNDKIPVPLWLRVYWRKGHPEVQYSAADPTGGYPLVLKEVYEWMITHQELRPNSADEPKAPLLEADRDGDGLGVITAASTVGTNVRASGAQTSPRSESDIRINYWNPLKVIAACNNISASGQQAQLYSSDGGATWGQSFLPLTSTDAFHSDPAVDWTSDGTAWSTTIGIKGNTLKMRAYKSTNGGQTWTFDNTFSGTQKNTDKELMWVDHSATSPFKDNIYACWHNGNPAFANRRNGPAGSWLATPVQVSGTESTGTAIGCDVKTNSAGDAFVFWPTTGNSKIVVAKSTNGGTSWPTRTVIATTFDTFDIGIPAMASRRALIYVSGGAYKTATLNNVYATWTDQTGVAGCSSPGNEPGTNAASACKSRIWFARSTDGGTTWGAPTMINNQASKNDQFNQWMGVDETTGRLAVIYYDTVNDATRKKTDVWYQTSADNGVTWSAAVKITTAMTDETVAGADSGNQYGDYNSLSIFASKVFPSWTDRRSGGKEEIWTAPITEP